MFVIGQKQHTPPFLHEYARGQMMKNWVDFTCFWVHPMNEILDIIIHILLLVSTNFRK